MVERYNATEVFGKLLITRLRSRDSTQLVSVNLECAFVLYDQMGTKLDVFILALLQVTPI